jgi:hypothetical protein
MVAAARKATSRRGTRCLAKVVVLRCRILQATHTLFDQAPQIAVAAAITCHRVPLDRKLSAQLPQSSSETFAHLVRSRFGDEQQR